MERCTTKNVFGFAILSVLCDMAEVLLRISTRISQCLIRSVSHGWKVFTSSSTMQSQSWSSRQRCLCCCCCCFWRWWWWRWWWWWWMIYVHTCLNHCFGSCSVHAKTLPEETSTTVHPQCIVQIPVPHRTMTTWDQGFSGSESDPRSVQNWKICDGHVVPQGWGHPNMHCDCCFLSIQYVPFLVPDLLKHALCFSQSSHNMDCRWCWDKVGHFTKKESDVYTLYNHEQSRLQASLITLYTTPLLSLLHPFGCICEWLP